MTRAFLLAVARILIGAVCAAQLAVAAYACPALVPAITGPPAAPAGLTAELHATSLPGVTAVAMFDCNDMAGGMDLASPNLCAEHCKQGLQSDQASTLSVPAAVLTLRYTLRPPPDAATALPRPARVAPCAGIAAPPPHAILHCVFRI